MSRASTSPTRWKTERSAAQKLNSHDKNTTMKKQTLFTLIVFLAGSCAALQAQQKTILVDVSHGQKFYSDPTDNVSTDLVPAERLTYMTGELAKNGSAHGAKISYLKAPIAQSSLAGADLLFIHVPSQEYSLDECSAIRQYVANGGSLFIVMEEDYWATLDQVNVNDIVKPFGITFKSNSPDATSGGHSIAGKVTQVEYSIPSHGSRIVEGGTPFAYSNASQEHPFAVYLETKGGGKVVAMGEGMVSLYMNSWQDVDNYQCADFMGEVIGWLLAK